MINLLTDGILKLRAPEPYDRDLFIKWENDPTLWDTGCTVAPYSIHLIDDYINNYNPDIFATRQLRMMVELVSTGDVVGAIDLYDFDPVNKRAGVGFIIDPAHRGKGLGTQALSIVCRYSMLRLDVKQLYAFVGIDNKASLNTLEKASFKRSGKLRRWIRTGRNRYTDAFIYQIVF